MPAYEWNGASWDDSVPRVYDGAAWSTSGDEYWVWDGAEWQLIYPDPADAGELLPVTGLAVTAGPDDHSVTLGWSLPTQPTVTPTHAAIRIPDLSLTWQLFELPFTEYAHAALQPSTEYQFQIRLEEWILGVRNDFSPIESVFFATTAAPVGVPAQDPGGTAGDSIVPLSISVPSGGTWTAPATNDGCWLEWELFYVDITTLAWVTTGTTGTWNGSVASFTYDLATLDATKTYRFCFRTACDTDTDGVADTFGAWTCGASFIGLSDWDGACGGIGDSAITTLTAVDDAVYGFPQMCVTAAGEQIMIDRVSGLEIGKGADFLWAFNDGDDWMVQADSDGGNTLLAYLPAIEAVLVPAQDSTFLVRYRFDDAHVLSARSYTIAMIGGLKVLFGITETVTGWTPTVTVSGENGLITLTGTELPLDTDTHTLILRWDASADKDLWVDGTLADTDSSGDDYSAATATPYYTTKAKEFGITGQQAGWDRLLTDDEIVLFMFDPYNDPDVAAWFDSTDAAYRTVSGSNVLTWTDRINGHQMDVYNVDYPLTGTRTLNDLNVFDFGSAGVSGMISAPGNNILSSLDEFEMMAVAEPDAVGQSVICGEGNRTTGQFAPQLYMQVAATTGNFNTNFYDNDDQLEGTLNNGASVVGAAHLFNARLSTADTLYQQLDGGTVQSDTGSGAHSQMNRFAIGMRYYGSASQGWNFDGGIGDIVVFNKVLSDAKRLQWQSFLQTRWGL